MKVKRFFAPDMRQAMQRVREEIGPDAVIVSNHRVAGGVEVVAAHEHEYEAAQEEFKRKRAAQKNQQETAKRASVGSNAQSNLSEELRKAQARIATAQQGGGGVIRDKNRQLEQDDADLSDILDTLKQRQRVRAREAATHFEQRRQSSAVPNVPASQPEVTSTNTDPRAALRQETLIRDSNTRATQTYESQARASEETAISAMQQEIAALKTLLQRQSEAPAHAHADGQAQFQAQPQPQPHTMRASRGEPVESIAVKVERRLERIGLGAQLSRQLTNGISDQAALDDAWRSTLTRLSDTIPVESDDFIERGGMIAFVGPTGVGKTTTIGKLAARYVLKHGSSSLALVTTDSYRIAAHEQLLTFGRILDVPVRVVDENHSLDEVLISLRSKRLVLIDTAGMNAHEPHTQAQLSMLQDVTVRLKKLLVLSCSSQRHVVESAYETYSSLGLSGCVLSKLDESGSVGEALDLIVENGLPVAYVTDGQRVPDDIDVAHKRDLVSRAVVTAQKASRKHRIFQESRQERLSQDEQWTG